MTTTTRKDPLDKYFTDDDDRKQVKPLPKKWLDASRFNVGDQIRYLDDCLITVVDPNGDREDPPHVFPRHRYFLRNLKGQVGVVVKANDGYGRFPARWVDDGGDLGGTWIGQSAGWLTVRFPFDYYGKEMDGTYKPRVCHLHEEGVVWERV